MSPPIMSRFDLFFVILDECNEVTDFYIARHIINFHRFKEQGIEPDFNTKQLQMYLTYARGLKPQLSPDARDFLVKQYSRMRQADATGVSRSSYRITVRQLESMVRLSEALAKLEGQGEVLIRHAMEAVHLLKTSIVHVEQENISLDDEDASAPTNRAEFESMAEDSQQTEANQDQQLVSDVNQMDVDGAVFLK